MRKNCNSRHGCLYKFNLYGYRQKVNIPTIYNKKKKRQNQNLSFLYVISPNLNAKLTRKNIIQRL